MSYDVVIKNGLLVDGTGAPARHADVMPFTLDCRAHRRARGAGR